MQLVKMKKKKKKKKNMGEEISQKTKNLLPETSKILCRFYTKKLCRFYTKLETLLKFAEFENPPTSHSGKRNGWGLSPLSKIFKTKKPLHTHKLIATNHSQSHSP